MARLVVVSNRLADPRKVSAGGLAVALGAALANTGGLWFGWSGRLADDESLDEAGLQLQQAGPVKLAAVDIGREDYKNYYEIYSNGVLWPVLHYRLDLARFGSGAITGYRRVNRLFAQRLQPLLESGDLIWIHDYHLIPLAAELRAIGCENPIGFFLHVPLPPPPILAAIPEHAWLVRSLFACDLVGFQTRQDLTHFSAYVQTEARGRALGEGCFEAFGRTLCAGAFPIGVDLDEFCRLAARREARETFATTRQQYSRRNLLVGVDRLDYSKGLPQRMRAFRELLSRYPENRDKATLIQIVSPSRETVDAYADLLRELEGLCGSINGDFGNLDWMPVRYIHRTVARRRLPGLYRAARVGLITPLRDGMNLVAKEYVAAQDPEDPGVLVLSRFAGAAEQLREALLVNPYDIEGTAEAIQQALTMPLAERRSRHDALLQRIREHDVHRWCADFLHSLQIAGERNSPQAISASAP